MCTCRGWTGSPPPPRSASARRARARGSVPIVALTAHAMLDDRERCLEAGMDAYVSKPFTASELLKTVQGLGIHANRVEAGEPGANNAGTGAARGASASVLSGASGSGVNGVNIANSGNGANGVNSPNSANNANGGVGAVGHSHGGHVIGIGPVRVRPDIIDRDELMARMGGERSAAATARAYVSHELSVAVIGSPDAIDARDVDRLRRRAHTLRGAMSLFARRKRRKRRASSNGPPISAGQPSTRRFAIAGGTGAPRGHTPDARGWCAAMKILLAEDEQVSRLALEATVQQWGFEPVSAEDGHRALELLTRPIRRASPFSTG